MDFDILVILGPTAVGKTALAARVCARAGGEIISADSRQVYRGMDIGTGKDLADYVVDGRRVPCHLIDVVDAGARYNVALYQMEFRKAYDDIRCRGKVPVLCGGSGLYIEAVIKEFDFRSPPVAYHSPPAMRVLCVGLALPRELRRERITARLHHRLDNGLVEEARRLLQSGVTVDDLLSYGLEYKYLALYLTGKLSYDEMTAQLNTAIHQFAKRQMTWFRGMERRGVPIRWIDATLPVAEQVEQVLLMGIMSSSQSQ
jgi:tRNA dimethylallyltransferase